MHERSGNILLNNQTQTLYNTAHAVALLFVQSNPLYGVCYGKTTTIWKLYKIELFLSWQYIEKGNVYYPELFYNL